MEAWCIHAPMLVSAVVLSFQSKTITETIIWGFALVTSVFFTYELGLLMVVYHSNPKAEAPGKTQAVADGPT